MKPTPLIQESYIKKNHICLYSSSFNMHMQNTHLPTQNIQLEYYGFDCHIWSRGFLTHKNTKQRALKGISVLVSREMFFIFTGSSQEVLT